MERNGRAKKSALRMRPEEDAFIIKYWEQHSVEDIAKMLGRGTETVRYRGNQLGLTGILVSRRTLGALA